MRWRGLEGGCSRRPFHNYQDEELDDLKIKLRLIKEKYQAEDLEMFCF